MCGGRVKKTVSAGIPSSATSESTSHRTGKERGGDAADGECADSPPCLLAAVEAGGDRCRRGRAVRAGGAEAARARRGVAVAEHDSRHHRTPCPRAGQADGLGSGLAERPGAATIVAEIDGGMVPLVETDPQSDDRRRGKRLFWKEAKICLAHPTGARAGLRRHPARRRRARRAVPARLCRRRGSGHPHPRARRRRRGGMDRRARGGVVRHLRHLPGGLLPRLRLPGSRREILRARRPQRLAGAPKGAAEDEPERGGFRAICFTRWNRPTRPRTPPRCAPAIAT